MTTSNSGNVVPIIESVNRVKALLDFIDKEPAMQWLLHRVDKARESAWKEGTNSIDQYFGDSTVVLRAYVDDRYGRTRADATMIYDWEQKEWIIQLGEECHLPSNQICIGKALDIRKITDCLQLSGHDFMEAAAMFGQKEA